VTPDAKVVVADAGFAGRLDLRTGAFAQADAFLRAAVERHGMAGSVESDADGSTRIYRLAGSRESIRALVAALGEIWEKFDATTLHVESLRQYAEAVTIPAVTPEQAVTVIAQNNTEASLETARNYGVRNRIAREMPGSEILRLVNDGVPLVGIGSLTIILRSSK